MYFSSGKAVYLKWGHIPFLVTCGTYEKNRISGIGISGYQEKTRKMDEKS
jgi:hypothetical protein